MRVLFLAIGDRSVASSRVRVYSYLPYLRKQNFKLFVIRYTSSWQSRKILAKEALTKENKNFIAKVVNRIYSTGAVLAMLILAPFFDVVYIQKVALFKFTIMLLRALNKNIVFDFDDAVFIYQDITYMLQKAAGVVVSNRHLKRYASRYNKKVYELISPVEIGTSPFQGDDNSVTLGWIGSPAGVRYLSPLTLVFKSLKEKFQKLNIEFMGINRYGQLEPLSDIVKLAEWSLEGEKRFLGGINIGIMPLLDDEWSKGKGGYKILQYMAMGIPCVASPVGVNKEIIKDGASGFLATTQDEWVEKLSSLIGDRALRLRMGREGREIAREQYSYEKNLSKLVSILEKTGCQGKDSERIKNGN